MSPIAEQKSPDQFDPSPGQTEPKMPAFDMYHSPEQNNDNSIPIVPMHERGFKVDPNNALPFSIQKKMRQSGQTNNSITNSSQRTK